MQKAALGIIAIAALIGSPALAADMALKAPPPAPTASWTGWYVGLDGGFGLNTQTGNNVNINPAGVVSGTGAGGPTADAISPEGSFFGGEAGYNWQNGVFVYGIESDIQWSHIQQAGTVNAPCCEPTLATPAGTDLWSANANLDWYGTTRARLGILASPRLLFYATGGAIYGGATLTGNWYAPATPGFGYPSSASATRGGGVVGAGFEYAFLGNLSAKAEALFYDMGTLTSPFTCPTGATTCSVGYTAQGTFRIEGARSCCSRRLTRALTSRAS
ncbi:MAG: outer membrane protein [Beijerinckiaceae bacterium]